MRALGAAVQSLRLKHQIHCGRARHVAAFRLCPFFCERCCVRAAALEARAMSSRERGRLIEEKQCGVAIAPDRMMAPLEAAARSRSIAARPSAALSQTLIVAVKAPAAIAHKKPARGRGDQLAERIDAVLQRHLLGASCAALGMHGLRDGGRIGGREGLFQAFLKLLLELVLRICRLVRVSSPPPAVPREMGGSGEKINPAGGAWGRAAPSRSAG